MIPRLFLLSQSWPKVEATEMLEEKAPTNLTLRVAVWQNDLLVEQLGEGWAVATVESGLSTPGRHRAGRAVA